MLPSELRVMLNGTAWRRVTDEWQHEIKDHPKLSVLKFICKK
jgi:hypothetical protein